VCPALRKGTHVLTRLDYRAFNYLAEPEEVTRYGQELYDLVANGTIKVRVHREYPFTAQGVQDAHSDLASGTTTGKLIVRVAGQ
jgi:NADPH2:quinone reductase